MFKLAPTLLLVKCIDGKMCEWTLGGANFNLAPRGPQTNKKADFIGICYL